MQAYAVIVRPTEAELNRVWMAQVFEPYQRTLASKYPFDRASRLEAAPAEIAKVFGTDGVIAKFVEQSLGALVLKLGDGVTPRTWADMGVRLRPDFVVGLSLWIAPLNGQAAGGGAASGGGGATAAAEAQTVFQMLPLPSPGLTEYTVEVDGQVMRYRNGAVSWAHFVWPGPGTPGVHITGVTLDGKQVEFFNEAGRFGLEKMISAAQRKRLDNQLFELHWPQGVTSVGVQLRIISNAATPVPAAPAAASAAGGGLVARPGALPSIIAGQDDGAVAGTLPGAPTAPAAPVESMAPAMSGMRNNNKEGAAS